MTPDLSEIPLTAIDGQPASLADYGGQVLLIVNTASKCGLTPQYEGLEALYAKYRDEGFAVLGFPANDFAGQEPGDNAEIAGFCRSTFGVEFPMFAKIAVTGTDKHPLYAALIAAAPDTTGETDDFRAKLAGHGLPVLDRPEVLWNFEKFLVGRDGAVVGRFAPTMLPEDDRLVRAVERELFTTEG